MKTFKGIEPFTWLKYFKKYLKPKFLTLGHYHPDDDLVSKIFGLFLFQHVSSFLNLSKLYGQSLAFLDQFLPKNDKI